MSIPESLKTPLMVGTVALGLAAALHLPTLRNYLTLRDRTQVLEQELSQPAVQLEPVQNRVDALHQEIANFARNPARAASPQDVLSAVADTAVRAGVDTYDTRLSEPVHYKEFSVLPVKVTLTADFKAAYDVLAAIEADTRLMRVDQMSLHSTARGGSSNKVTLSLDLSAFFIPADGEQP